MIGFDFDKTITEKDTLLGFFLLLNKRKGLIWILFPIYFLCMLLCKLHVLSNSNLKLIGITLFLKGLTKEEIEIGSETYSKKIKFNDIYNSLLKDNEDIIIISASFEYYIKEIFKENVNISVIGSTLQFDSNDLVCGLEFNCYGENKKEVLISQEITCLDKFYTDSFSDKPVFSLSKQVFLVKNNEVIKYI